MRWIVSEAEKCTGSEDQSNFARWYVDAHTYLEDEDYSSSVMKSWLVIEQHINSTWRAHTGRDSDPNFRAPPNKKDVLEALRKAGKITNDEHARLDGLRDRRNEIIHGGSITSRTEASSYLAVAEELTRSLLSIPKPTS